MLGMGNKQSLIDPKVYLYLHPQERVFFDSADTPEKLKAYLLSGTPRVIDRLIIDGSYFPQQLLKAIAKALPEQDWFDLISTKNDAGLDVLGHWMNHYSANTQGINTMIDHLKPSHIVDLIIRNEPCKDFAGDDVEYSIVTHPNLRYVVRDLESKAYILDDESILKILYAKTGGSRKTNLLRELSTQGEDTKLIEFITDPNIAKKVRDHGRKYLLRNMATHFLGLHDKDTTFDYQQNRSTKNAQDLNKENSDLTYEGAIKPIAIAQFKKILGMYRPSAEFREAFAIIKKAYNKKNPGDPSEYISQYQKGELIAIPSGWTKHAIYIGATQDHLVVANRGQGMHPKGGCIIYKLEKPLSDKDITFFMEDHPQQEIEKKINQVVKKNQQGSPVIICAMPSKAQKYGTCAIANQKALIDGLLALFELDKYPDARDNVVKISRKEYKRFTQFTRTNILKEIIDEIFTSNLNQQELLTALSDFCNQHVDFDKNEELKLFEFIVNNLSQAQKNEFYTMLQPFPLVLAIALEKYGVVNLPEVVKKLSESGYILSKENHKKMLISIKRYLGNEFSEEEAENYFTVYFEFLAEKKLYDILNLQVQYLSPKKIFELMAKDNAKLLMTLCKYSSRSPQMQALAELMFSKLTPEQKKSLITPDVLHVIKNGDLLKAVIKDFDNNYVLGILTKPVDKTIRSNGVSLKDDVGLMPLQNTHDLNYLEYLEARLGKEQFKSLLHYPLQNGETGTILAQSELPLESFKFILERLGDEELIKDIERTKSMSKYDANIFIQILEKYGDQKDQVAKLQLLADRLPSELVKKCCSEQDKDAMSVIYLLVQNEELLTFLKSHFSVKELAHLFNQPSYRGSITTSFLIKDKKEVIMFLMEGMTKDEFNAFIAEHLENNIQKALSDNSNVWFLKLLQERMPNELQAICNKKYKEFLKATFNDPEAFAFISTLITAPEKNSVIEDLICDAVRDELISYKADKSKMIRALAAISPGRYQNIAKKINDLVNDLGENAMIRFLSQKVPDYDLLLEFKSVPVHERHHFFDLRTILFIMLHSSGAIELLLNSDLLKGSPELEERSAFLNLKTVLGPVNYQHFENFIGSQDPVHLYHLNRAISNSPLELFHLQKCLTFLFGGMPTDERLKFFPSDLIGLVNYPRLLSVMVEGMTEQAKMSLMSTSPIPPLKHVRSLNYLQTLGSALGKELFKSLLKYDNGDGHGQNHTILDNYISKPDSFQFVMSHLSDKELKKHIEDYKQYSEYQQNLLVTMLVKHQAMSSQEIASDILQNIKSLTSRFPKEEIKTWLIEKDIDGYSAIDFAIHDEELFKHFASFFNVQELDILLTKGERNLLESDSVYPRPYLIATLELKKQTPENARPKPLVMSGSHQVIATQGEKNPAVGEVNVKQNDPKKLPKV